MCRRIGLMAKLSAVTISTKTAPMSAMSAVSVITATNEQAINPTRAMSAAHVVTPMRCFTMASNEGNNVTEANIMINTPTTAPIANPRANASPMTNNPSNEMMTVIPAKITARPEVSTASITASSTVRPSASPSR